MKAEVRCPVCQSSFLIGKSGNAVTELSEGVHYLVPETIRNENVSKNDKVNERLNTLKEAGINVDKLRELMGGNSSFKDIFEDDDPIVKELSESGFIRNKELFRRWITAQTFRLLKDPVGWTHAVRKFYCVSYVFQQTRRELELLIKLSKKCPDDIRFSFFALDDLKSIFTSLAYLNSYAWNNRETLVSRIKYSSTYSELLKTVRDFHWHFRNRDQVRLPKRWLNCFKGAGTYYTLQNIIRTHGLVLHNCKDMNESLDYVEKIYESIISYKPSERRWDILLSVLSNAVEKSGFELKY